MGEKGGAAGWIGLCSDKRTMGLITSHRIQRPSKGGKAS